MDKEYVKEWLGGSIIFIWFVLVLSVLLIFSRPNTTVADGDRFYREYFPEDNVACYTQWHHHEASIDCIQLDAN